MVPVVVGIPASIILAIGGATLTETILRFLAWVKCSLTRLRQPIMP